MDSDQFISFFQSSLNSPTLDRDCALQSDTSAVAPLPQPSCSNQSLALLNAFCSDENTVKGYLLDGNQSNNHNNAGQQFFDSSIENRPSSNDWTNPSIENLNESTLDTDYAAQCDTLAVQPFPQSPRSDQSLALLKAFCSDEDTVKSYLLDDDQLNNHNNAGQQFLNSNWYHFNDSDNPFNSLNAIEDPSPVPTSISSYISTDPLAVESLHQSKIHNTYNNLKLNFISLLERGYKLTLSLNTDNSEVDEPWNPDVSQKILSVYFSSLSLRSEYLSNDMKLDGFQSLLMEEAYAAFKGQKHLNLFSNLNDRRRAKASPDKLISICNGMKGFRKIETSDKTVLLSNIYNHLHLMEGIFNYDPIIDGWDAPAYDFKSDRRDTFLFNQFLHDEMVYVIETFPDRFRNDTNVIILMYLIIIFNGEISGLKHTEMIRYEQFSYIYLLRRYLRTICESDCEASDNFYRLMVKIEQMRLLARKVKKNFLLLLNEPLLETITKSITLRGPKTIPQILQAQHINI